MLARAIRILTFFLVTSGHAAAQDASVTELLMFEQPGCIYCAQWNEEIAPEYALTDEGKAAPLRRLQLRAAAPDDITLARPVTFTPTFVLVDGGREVDRIEGYPGEDFFWPLLSQMLGQLQAAR